jgi:hypothetical protein
MTVNQPWPGRPVPGPPRHAPEQARPQPRPPGVPARPNPGPAPRLAGPGPSAGQPPEIGQPERSEAAGEPTERVAAALAGLDGLDARPTGEHVAAFERVHVALTDALSAIDGV